MKLKDQFTNQKLYQEIQRIKREYKHCTIVRKAITRGPKKRYSELCDLDQIRLANKLFKCIIN